VVSPTDCGLAPLIPSNVDEHADEPCFLVGEAGWNRAWRAGRLQECFLNEIDSVIGSWNQPPGQAIQAFVVSVEQYGQPLRG